MCGRHVVGWFQEQSGSRLEKIVKLRAGRASLFELHESLLGLNNFISSTTLKPLPIDYRHHLSASTFHRDL